MKHLTFLVFQLSSKENEFIVKSFQNDGAIFLQMFTAACKDIYKRDFSRACDTFENFPFESGHGS